MTRRKRRNHSSALRAKITLAAQTGEGALTGLVDVHPSQIQD